MSSANRVSPRWEDPRTVAGFVSGSPNAVLMDQARRLLARVPAARVLDLGCGAGRNAVPLAELGCEVVGVDLSRPMIEAARARAVASPAAERLSFVLGPMEPLPFADDRFDLIVAHGVWNLATRDATFRAAVAEGARVARPGAELFLFTFSRNTLLEKAQPDAGERLIYSNFAGEPQCFLTEPQLEEELARVGFVRETCAPLTEYNRPPPGGPRTLGPVIWEGAFVYRPPAPLGF